MTARPIRRNAQTPDRNGKIFYTSTTSLAHISKPSKDVAIIPNCAGMPLDPSSVPAGMHDKLIIDATTPVAPEPNPRSVELLKPSPATPKWEAIFRDFMAAQKNQ